VHLKALCAIGSPERFFKQLENLGYHLESVYQWQDHYNYVENDLKRISEYTLYKNAISVMTEKDAVKIKPLLQKLNFLNNTDDCWWYLKVDASLPEEWWDKFDKLLDNILS
jgi:tetraacyldisaccharide 4'-kinase